MANSGPPQKHINDRFSVVEKIGSGGFAEVWRAVDTKGGPDVAVKFPQRDTDNDPEVVHAQFEEAYETLSRLKGGLIPTSLIRFVDGSINGPKYLATEYIDGEELASVVTRSSISPGIETAEQFGLPIARALGVLHRNGVMYLDCKPENVLVRDDHDEPVLIDFNTAETLADGGDTLFYDDPYKAPEQLPGAFEDHQSGPWTDVYGVAKLLVFLLTGETTNASETPVEGVDIRDYVDRTPDEIAEVLKRATKASPEDRPSDAVELVSALYRATDRDSAVAGITDDRTDVTCPVRPGDTVGRVADADTLPLLGVADSERYVSPVHFQITRDEDGWLVVDRSLNGTYILTPDGWQLLLSEEGYRRLSAEGHPRVEDGQPHQASRLGETATLFPVSPSYSVQLEFRTGR